MFGLIHNDKIVVGPRSWNRNFFLDYLNRNSLDASSLPNSAPSAAITTENWKLLPVTSTLTPSINSPFEQLIGPTWTINADNITGEYTKKTRDISYIKSDLKQTVAKNRYEAEISGIIHTFSDLEQVKVSTAREDRDVFSSYYVSMADDETISFKFKEGVFRDSITKTEVKSIADNVKDHIKAVFVWESNKFSEIDACANTTALEDVELRHDYQINNADDPNVIITGTS